MTLMSNVVLNVVPQKSTPPRPAWKELIPREWNAAHKTLLSGRDNAQRGLASIDEEIDEAMKGVADLRNRRDRAKKSLAEIEDAIAGGGFTPPDGLDIWGERI